MDSAGKPTIGQILKSKEYQPGSASVEKDSKTYLRFFDASKQEEEQVKERKEGSRDMVNQYYDLVTDFYEYGWGESFHFACLSKGESREHAFAKAEYRLALKLGLGPEDKVLDLGCGIGGPARHIAKFSDCKIVGLNNNAYQIQRAEELTRKTGLQSHCSYVKGDFLQAPFSSDSFDKIYAIEATCHAPELDTVYAEAYRMLKPGGLFGCYEWVMTNKYDANNHYYKKIKQEVLEGNALPDLHKPSHIHACLKKVGFEILEEEDLTQRSEIPWYSVLLPQWTVSDLKITPLGRWLTHLALVSLETVKLVPRGTTQVHRTLCKGADALAKAGKEEIFSPMYFFLVRKPLKE